MTFSGAYMREIWRRLDELRALRAASLHPWLIDIRVKVLSYVASRYWDEPPAAASPEMLEEEAPPPLPSLAPPGAAVQAEERLTGCTGLGRPPKSSGVIRVILEDIRCANAFRGGIAGGDEPRDVLARYR